LSVEKKTGVYLDSLPPSYPWLKSNFISTLWPQQEGQFYFLCLFIFLVGSIIVRLYILFYFFAGGMCLEYTHTHTQTVQTFQLVKEEVGRKKKTVV
jgi:hypothetical protein